MTNAEALGVTLDAMRASGLVEPVDEAVVTAALSLAAAVDADPGHASLWREYQSALRTLRELVSDDDDGFGAAFAELQAAVRNRADRPPEQA